MALISAASKESVLDSDGSSLIGVPICCCDLGMTEGLNTRTMTVRSCSCCLRNLKQSLMVISMQ